MIAHREAFLAGLLCLIAGVVGLAAAEEGDEAAPERPAGATSETAGQVAPDVQMAEFSLGQGRGFQGRVVYEDEGRIDLEKPDGSVTGYRKEMISGEIRRFSITQLQWVERGGDLRQSEALDAGDPAAELMKALHAYQQALVLATDTDEKARIEAKIGAVQQLQDAWHTETQRRQELEIMLQESELLKAQRQLTTQRLAALKQQEDEVRRLRTEVDRLNNDNRRLATALDGLAQEIADLEDELDDLTYFDRFYVRRTVFQQLQNDHAALVREFRQMQRRMRDR